MAEINSIIEKLNILSVINDEIKKTAKYLYVFKDNWNQINIVLVTNKDEVYCYGRNDCGVLGFGHENPVDEVTINVELSNKSIIDIKNAKFHTIARDIYGKLYCWGQNRYLGNGKENYSITKPELNEHLLNENIIDICCGGYHTLVLTSNNEVYAWGENPWGQIGNSDDDNIVLLPLKLDELKGKKVRQICSGHQFSMALTERGCVYSWGDNRYGQLGLNNRNESEKNPKLIQIEVKIQKISCGFDHSLLLSCEGDIYVFGRNEFHQLGLHWDNYKQFTPIKLNHPEKFIDIASHYLYEISTALSEKGLYYVWGHCGTDVGIVCEPKETEFKSFNEIFAMIKDNSIVENGKYIKNWIEIRKLGEGSFGTVFEVKNKSDENKIFAVKKIPLHDEKSKDTFIEDSWKEFSNSFEILSLENDFLIKYHDVWIEYEADSMKSIRKYSHKSTIYIQMDLCDKTLTYINEEMRKDSKLYLNDSLTQLGFYTLCELYIEILKGVKFLHNKNIIHRDLHPGNILVRMCSNNGCIKITDFGYAKVHDQNKFNTGDIGNITYSAPEVLDCEYYDMRADIYSLGVILQELFDIDVNSEQLNNANRTSLLIFKYENLKSSSIEMTNEVYEERPNCEQILDERENWALNKSEFNFEEELNFLLEISDENRSYLQNMIVSNMTKMKNEKVVEHLYVFRDHTNELNVISVTNKDEVYCRGGNKYGILGFDHQKSVEMSTFNENLSNKQIIDFENGLCHIIARTNNGKLYCWGVNLFLGNGREDFEISKPESNKYLLNSNIIDMCCGAFHTLVLTSNKEIYAWGYNSEGQIGSGTEIVVSPLKLDEFNAEKVAGISCGFKHSMALTDSGRVYSWGYNEWGQLGLNNENKNESKPQCIQIEVKIKKISCGKHHSLLLSCEGDIYSFGSNHEKQLGLETNGENQLNPIKLNHSEKFIEIASHYRYNTSAALSENNLYYIWGNYENEEIISEPKEIQINSFAEIFSK